MFVFQVGQNRRRGKRAAPKRVAPPVLDNATQGIVAALNPEHLERLAERARNDAERMASAKGHRREALAVTILSGLLQDWARRMADEDNLPVVAQHLVNAGVRNVDWAAIARRALG